MKAQMSFPLNQSNLSAPVGNLLQLSAHTPGQYLQAENDDLQKIIDRITQPKSPAFVAGEKLGEAIGWFYDRTQPWVASIMESLPYVGLPCVGAQTIPSKMDESDELAIEKAMQNVKVIGKKNKEEEQKIKERFEKIFRKAMEEGRALIRENIKLWVNCPINNIEASIKLYKERTQEGFSSYDKAPGAYFVNDNSIRFLATITDNQLLYTILHETKHASDATRYGLAALAGKAKNPDSALATRGYANDKEKDVFERAVNDCMEEVSKVEDKIMKCIEEKKGCDDETVKKIETSYRRKIDLHLTKKEVGNRKLKLGEPFKGYKISGNPKRDELIVTDISEDGYKFSIEDPLMSFAYGMKIVRMYIEQYPSHQQNFEKSAFISEIVSQPIKEKVCPKLAEFEKRENKEAKNYVEKWRKNSGISRDDL